MASMFVYGRIVPYCQQINLMIKQFFVHIQSVHWNRHGLMQWFWKGFSFFSWTKTWTHQAMAIQLLWDLAALRSIATSWHGWYFKATDALASNLSFSLFATSSPPLTVLTIASSSSGPPRLRGSAYQHTSSHTKCCSCYLMQLLIFAVPYISCQWRELRTCCSALGKYRYAAQQHAFLHQREQVCCQSLKILWGASMREYTKNLFSASRC